jgi:hypothetical protein
MNDQKKKTTDLPITLQPPLQLQSHQTKAQETMCSTSNVASDETFILPDKIPDQPNEQALTLTSQISSTNEKHLQQPPIITHLILNPSSPEIKSNLNETSINENEKKSTASDQDLEQKLIIEPRKSSVCEVEDEEKNVPNLSQSQIKDNLNERKHKRSRHKLKNSITLTSSTDTSSELSQSQIDRLISAISISTSGDSSLSQRNETTNSEQLMSPNVSNVGFYKNVYYDQYLDQDLEQKKRNENEPSSLEEEEDYLD